MKYSNLLSDRACIDIFRKSVRNYWWKVDIGDMIVDSARICICGSDQALWMLTLSRSVDAIMKGRGFDRMELTISHEELSTDRHVRIEKLAQIFRVTRALKHAEKQQQRMRLAAEILTHKLGRDPKDEEVAEALNLPPMIFRT